MNLLWLRAIIPGIVWLAGVAYLSLAAALVAMVSDSSRWRLFAGGLVLAFAWPLWFWSTR